MNQEISPYYVGTIIEYRTGIRDNDFLFRGCPKEAIINYLKGQFDQEIFINETDFQNLELMKDDCYLNIKDSKFINIAHVYIRKIFRIDGPKTTKI